MSEEIKTDVEETTDNKYTPLTQEELFEIFLEAFDRG